MKFEEQDAIFYNFNKMPKIGFVYFLIKNKEVVYVGKTTQGIVRPLSHKDKDFDSFYMIKCDYEELGEKEMEMIFKYKPKYNGNMTVFRDFVGISYVNELLVEKGILLRSSFIKYSIFKCNIQYFTFKSNFFIHKKDVSLLIDYISKENKNLYAMQSESTQFYIDLETEYRLMLVLNENIKTLKDLIYFNVISQSSVLQLCDYLKSNNYAITNESKNLILQNFPELKDIKYKMNVIENYKMECKNENKRN